MASIRQAVRLLTSLPRRGASSRLSASIPALFVQRTSACEQYSRGPRSFCSETGRPQVKAKHVSITFVDRDGEEQTVQAKIGDSLLEVAKQYDIDLEGACEGTLACSTCHLIVEEEWYKRIPDPVTDEEQDMLDLAYGLTDTSRLGCQILVSKDIENIRLKVPENTADAREL
nr:mitochondrial ferredoxin-1 [Halisarca dujardinii]